MDERIIDTCCLLNLFASGAHEAVLRHVGGVFVTEHVQAETLWIRGFGDDSPPTLVPKQIDLTACLNEGLLAICRLEHAEEFAWFVRFAQRLDDGEASVLAIAKVRGWIVATDDRKARRIAAEHAVSTLSTAEVIHRWTKSAGISNAACGALLKNIERFGRFRPHRSDALYDWWMDIVALLDE